jgi:hypothetical protein
MISVFLDGRQESKDGKRTRVGEEKKGKAKERAVFSPFLSSGFMRASRRSGTSASLSSFFPSLSAIEKRPNLDAAREFPRCSYPLLSPQVRQLDNLHRPIQRN